jgi:hypothetical protein
VGTVSKRRLTCGQNDDLYGASHTTRNPGDVISKRAPGKPPSYLVEIVKSIRRAFRGGTALETNPACQLCVSHLNPIIGYFSETAGDRGWFALGFVQVRLPMKTIRLCAECW